MVENPRSHLAVFTSVDLILYRWGLAKICAHATFPNICLLLGMHEPLSPMPMPVPLESRAEYQMSSSVTADISALRQRSLTELEAYQLARNTGQ